ncbi:MAG: tol-pal system-associated acyl-CoA thioesterase [Gammaproteobacteria bacterium]|jgi:tol-pal system-associated acyl-CoA thioesterase|nr:tol-pal system-associated acyl-CoA thioesterase [Chromatiales bacterium]MDP6673507.1 tol-pal system-associated acyl-CoA thioesterase [Gammaproteobacteria bacterium]
MDEWHEFRVRVYFEDTDAQGVVYFTNYLKFMERGRTEWLRELGVEQDWLLREHGLCFTLTETGARFHRPARFNDQLLVRTRIARLARASMALEQTVSRLAANDSADSELLCSADCVAACIDMQSFRPRRIPAELFAAERDFVTQDQRQV